MFNVTTELLKLSHQWSKFDNRKSQWIVVHVWMCLSNYKEGSDTVKSGGWIPAFQTSILPQSSEYKWCKWQYFWQKCLFSPTRLQDHNMNIKQCQNFISVSRYYIDYLHLKRCLEIANIKYGYTHSKHSCMHMIYANQYRVDDKNFSNKKSKTFSCSLGRCI
jgi:hypothetical protein